MSKVLQVVLFCIYAGTAIDQLIKGNGPMAMVYACYGAASIGWWFAL